MDQKNKKEKQSEPRRILDRYYSVQLSISVPGSVYRSATYNISPSGICLLVEEHSELLNYIKVGDILDIKYYPTKLLGLIKK